MHLLANQAWLEDWHEPSRRELVSWRTRSPRWLPISAPTSELGSLFFA